MRTNKLIAATLATLLAAPVLAQTPPPPPAATGAGPGEPGMHGGRHGGRHERMFKSLSPEGRKIMADAMRAARNDDDRADIRAARDRVGALLSADKLDVNALRSAMDAERRLVDARHKDRQDAMLGAFQKLSVADRKAFVADAKAGADRMKARMGKWRDRPAGV